MGKTVQAKALQKQAAGYLKQIEQLREQLEQCEQECYDRLSEQLRSGAVEGSDEDKQALRDVVEELDELMDTRLQADINDGRDNMARLREVVSEMVAIEDGKGDIYGEDYKYLAELCGLELSDRQGCWTYQEYECMNAGYELLRALEHYDKDGTPGYGTGRDLLSGLAYKLKVRL